MAVTNGYATLTEFRESIAPPGNMITEDESDDRVIETLLEAASRRVDDLTGRAFFPSVKTRLYDVPEDDELWFGDDLLALTTLTNGDSTEITSSDYILLPANAYPKYAVKIKDISSVLWESDSSDSSQQVISVLGFWGYHEDYSVRAWKTAGTLGAAWNSTSTLTATMTTGHTLDIRGGEIIKIDSEIMNTDSATTTGLVVQARGDNGSTAATHINGSTVYVWQPMKDLKQLTLEIAKIMYRSRYGENMETTTTYTSSGVIVSPRSLPVWAQEIISRYRRIAWS